MSNGWKAALGVAAALLLLVGLVVVGGFVALMPLEELPVTQTDRDLLVTPGELLTELADAEPEIKKARHLDGSVSLELTYDVPDPERPYLSSTITYEAKSGDALAVHYSQWAAAKLTMEMAGDNMRVEEMENFYPLRRGSGRFAVIRAQGEPVGNMFSAHIGNNTVFLLMTGVYIDDPETFRDLMEPKLSRLGKYR